MSAVTGLLSKNGFAYTQSRFTLSIPFHFFLDIKKLQDSLEKLHLSLNQNGVHQNSSLNDDIRVLLDVLQCPVFDSILAVQV